MASKLAVATILIEAEKLYPSRNLSNEEFEKKIDIFTKHLDFISDINLEKFWKAWSFQKDKMFLIKDAYDYHEKRFNPIANSHGTPRTKEEIERTQKRIDAIPDNDLEPED